MLQKMLEKLKLILLQKNLEAAADLYIQYGSDAALIAFLRKGFLNVCASKLWIALEALQSEWTQKAAQSPVEADKIEYPELADQIEAARLLFKATAKIHSELCVCTDKNKRMELVASVLDNQKRLQTEWDRIEEGKKGNAIIAPPPAPPQNGEGSDARSVHLQSEVAALRRRANLRSYLSPSYPITDAKKEKYRLELKELEDFLHES